MTETIKLDPAAVAVSRTELDITGYVSASAGINWGDAAIEAALTDMAVGSAPLEYRLPNRQIKVPLILKAAGATSFATIVREVQQKAALIQREGGWLLRQVDSTPLYADVVNATLHLGGSWLQSYQSADIDAELQLECLPDWYGDEVTLDSATATGFLASKLKLSSADAVIAGNYPGRCRIVVTDTSGNDQDGLIWAVRSRYYDSASTAALVYGCEALTPINGATSGTVSGASGGSAVSFTSPASPGQWVSFLSLEVASGPAPLTHRGSYRVWLRCQAASNVSSLRLLWGSGSLSNPETNDAMLIPGVGGWYLLDLGTVRLDAAPVGGQQWFGVLEADVQASGAGVIADEIYLQPLDEAAGVLTAAPASRAAGSLSNSEGAGLGANATGVGTEAWDNPNGITDFSNATASGSPTSLVPTNYLKATQFGFSLPATATIVGIEVAIWKTCSGFATDARVRLVKAGTVQTPDRSVLAAWPNSWTQATYGGPADLWGGSWTYSDINNSGFGVAFAAAVGGFRRGTLVGPAIASVGAPLTITVYFTLPSGLTVAQDAVVYADGVAEVRTDGAYRAPASSTVFGPVARVLGDLPRIPPAGMESRPSELLVRPTRGDLGIEPDAGLDSFTAQVKYRPSYLFRP